MRLLDAIGLVILATVAVGSATVWSFSGAVKPSAGVSATDRKIEDRIFLTREEIAAASRVSPEMAQVRSLLHVSGPMRFGDSIWNERGATTGEIWIRVDLAKQLISVFRGGDEIGTAVILYGADSHLTPQGTFSILGKSKQHRSRAYGALMPYSLWLTKDGVAIHASEVRRGLATHGCIGVPIDFSKRLFSIAEPGDKVVIVRS